MFGCEFVLVCLCLSVSECEKKVFCVCVCVCVCVEINRVCSCALFVYCVLSYTLSSALNDLNTFNESVYPTGCKDLLLIVASFTL